MSRHPLRPLSVAVVICALVLGTWAGTQPAVPPLEPGAWEGEYVDANGQRGRLTLALEVAGALLRGTYRLQLAGEDAAPPPIVGVLEGKVEGERVSFEVTLGAGAGGKGAAPAKSAYEGLIRPADPYARQALCGVAKCPPGGPFAGGVWIVWRFAPAK